MRKIFYLLFILLNCQNSFGQKTTHSFEIQEGKFLLDGKPFQIISGEMHYSRVPREAWRDRMKMAKAMGLNTIGTYVFWNLHEPQKDKFDFSGDYDIAEFVKVAKQEGLWVILRPSPYVCAEWEFGGYPYWLQTEDGMVVRSQEKGYIEEYRKYIMEVGKQLSPSLVTHGGNILMVQIENEYGSYGADKAYLKLNQDLFKSAGFDGILYTCDPEVDVERGHLPGLLPAVNGQDNPGRVKEVVNKNHNGKGPYFIAEWYPAWFDWWGTAHHTVPAENYSGKLDSVLAAGISINMYMFHGGTTRGFMNGANYKDTSPYEPQISSYDYDAPLDEAGNPTEKFWKFRSVIAKHLPPGNSLPAVPGKKNVGHFKPFELSQQTELFKVLPKVLLSKNPMTFESLKQDYGYLLYRTQILGGKKGLLKLKELRDYAIVFINGRRVATLDRRILLDSVVLDLPAGKVNLDIFVENMGRINFGKYLLENKKGITEKVTFDGQEILNWQMFKFPFSNIEEFLKSVKLSSKSKQGSAGPVLRSGTFNVKNPEDLYLDMRSWGKGVVWVNGHHLGKYWSIGPQQTIYLPKEWVKNGDNKITVLELLNIKQTLMKSIDKPILNELH